MFGTPGRPGHDLGRSDLHPRVRLYDLRADGPDEPSSSGAGCIMAAVEGPKPVELGGQVGARAAWIIDRKCPESPCSSQMTANRYSASGINLVWSSHVPGVE